MRERLNFKNVFLCVHDSVVSEESRQRSRLLNVILLESLQPELDLLLYYLSYPQGLMVYSEMRVCRGFPSVVTVLMINNILLNI